jgi:hypothetical protein
MMKDVFLEQMARLETNFEKSRNESRLRLWWEELSQCNDGRFRNAVTSIIRNEQRFPTLAVILSYVNSTGTEEITHDGCQYCGGRGWISVAMIHPYNPEKGYYSPSVPCKCRNSKMPTDEILNEKWGTANVDGKDYPIFFPPEKPDNRNEFDKMKRV